MKSIKEDDSVALFPFSFLGWISFSIKTPTHYYNTLQQTAGPKLPQQQYLTDSQPRKAKAPRLTLYTTKEMTYANQREYKQLRTGK